MDRARRALAVAAVFMALVAAVPAVLYLVGGAEYQRATTLANGDSPAAALGPAATAETLLSAWPSPATLLGNINLTLFLRGAPARLPTAIHWARQAVARNPTDPDLWVLLADLQLAGGEPGAAKASASTALGYGPWDPQASAVLGVVAASQNHRSDARKWLGRSLAVLPQRYLSSVLRDVNRGCRASPLSPQQPSLIFDCH